MLSIRAPGSSGATRRSTSPSMLFRCRSRPGSQSPEPEPEAGREHAGAALAVDSDEVRRVCRRYRARRRARRRARASARARRDRAVPAARSSAGPTGARPARVRNRVPAYGNLDRLAPHRPVRGEVGAGDDSAALRHQFEQRLGDRARVRAARALLGDELERANEAGLVELLARLEQPARLARTSARPSRIVITGSSIARHAACAAGIGTPSRASRRAGAQTSAHGSRPCSSPERVEPGRDAGDGAGRRPDRVVDELLAELHVQLEEIAPAAARNRAEAVQVARAAGSRRPSRSRARRRGDPSSRSPRRRTRGRRRRRRRQPIRRSRGSRPRRQPFGVAGGDGGVHGASLDARRRAEPSGLLPFCRPRSRPLVALPTACGDRGDVYMEVA